MIVKFVTVMELVAISMCVIVQLAGQILIVVCLYATKKLQQIHLCVQDMVHAYHQINVHVQRIGLVHSVILQNVMDFFKMIHKFVMVMELVSIPITVIVTLDGKASIVMKQSTNVLGKMQQIHLFVQGMGHADQKIYVNAQTIGLIHSAISHNALELLKQIRKFVMVEALASILICVIVKLDGTEMIVVYQYAMEAMQRTHQRVLDMEHALQKILVSALQTGMGRNVILHHALDILEMILEFVASMELVTMQMFVIVKQDGKEMIVAFRNVTEIVQQIHQCVQDMAHAHQKTHANVQQIGMVPNVK